MLSYIRMIKPRPDLMASTVPEGHLVSGRGVRLDATEVGSTKIQAFLCQYARTLGRRSTEQKALSCNHREKLLYLASCSKHCGGRP